MTIIERLRRWSVIGSINPKPIEDMQAAADLLEQIRDEIERRLLEFAENGSYDANYAMADFGSWLAARLEGE